MQFTRTGLALLAAFALVSLSSAYTAQYSIFGTDVSETDCIVPNDPCTTFETSTFYNNDTMEAQFVGFPRTFGPQLHFMDSARGPYSHDLSIIALPADPEDGADIDEGGIDLKESYSFHLDYEGGVYDLSVVNMTFRNGDKRGFGVGGGGCFGIDNPGGNILFKDVVFEDCFLAAILLSYLFGMREYSQATTDSQKGSALSIQNIGPSATVTLDNVTFINSVIDPESSGTGGALSISAPSSGSGSIVLVNVKIIGNSGPGGALDIDSSLDVTIDGLIIEGNTARGDSVVSLSSSGSSSLRDVIVSGNSQESSDEPLVMIDEGFSIEGLYIRDNTVTSGVLSRGSVSVVDFGSCVYVHDNSVSASSDEDAQAVVLETSFGFEANTVFGSMAVQRLEANEGHESFTVREDGAWFFSCGEDGFWVGQDASGDPLCLCAGDQSPRVVDGSSGEVVECECPAGEIAVLSYDETCSVGGFNRFTLKCEVLSVFDDPDGLNPALILGAILIVGLLGLGAAQAYKGYNKEGKDKDTGDGGADEQQSLNRMTAMTEMTAMTGVSEVQPRIERGADGSLAQRKLPNSSGGDGGRKGSAGRKKKGSIGRKKAGKPAK